jgi:hypothetical protein
VNAPENQAVSTFPEFAEDGPHTLLGLPSLTFFPALLAFEALHCCQKSWGFWLAI